METWNSLISGLDRDYYYEYVDMITNDWVLEDFQRFVDENDFDYLITKRESTLGNYLEGYRDDYMRLRGNDDFTLWKKGTK